MSREPIERFRQQLMERLGLLFPPGHQDLLRDVLQRRAGRRDQEAYLQDLESSYDDEEIARLAAELTVGETYFFRHRQQLQAFVQVAVPERLRIREKLRKLSILSVGCASGEEPYSLAMLLRQNFALSQWNVQILGVDVNRKALNTARNGIYSAWSVRETAANLLGRWFLARKQEFHLDKDILDSVQFEERNLNLTNADLWLPGRWDMIFCRNMLMYFAPERARLLLQNFARSLSTDGFLFLGAAENLRGLSDEFSLFHRDDCFYYQLASAPAPEPVLAAAPARARPRPAAPAAPAGPNIRALRELLDSERYGQALELLERLTPGPETSLWKLSIMVNSGRLEEAENLAQSLLYLGQTEAGAHLLLGLCRREAGQLGQARGYFERALRLDPKLAMAAVYLGMLLRRLGLDGLARTHLRQALGLLEKESDERLMLFGGGFRRSAWLALCQNELERCREPR